LQVGTIVVKDDKVLSIGYNGTPAGWDNNCEYEAALGFGDVVPPLIKTKPEVIHAEMNALGKLAKSNETSDGAVIYITHAPCFECAKLIHITGISKVYYRNSYRNNDGIEFLNKCNIEVTQL
jgi:dCMP deaminase